MTYQIDFVLIQYCDDPSQKHNCDAAIRNLSINIFYFFFQKHFQRKTMFNNKAYNTYIEVLYKPVYSGNSYRYITEH